MCDLTLLFYMHFGHLGLYWFSISVQHQSIYVVCACALCMLMSEFITKIVMQNAWIRVAIFIFVSIPSIMLSSYLTILNGFIRNGVVLIKSFDICQCWRWRWCESGWYIIAGKSTQFARTQSILRYIEPHIDVYGTGHIRPNSWKHLHKISINSNKWVFVSAFHCFAGWLRFSIFLLLLFHVLWKGIIKYCHFTKKMRKKGHSHRHTHTTIQPFDRFKAVWIRWFFLLLLLICHCVFVCLSVCPIKTESTDCLSWR